MDTVGPWELLIIPLVVGLLFGAARLPKMARSLGSASGSFAAPSIRAANPAPKTRLSSPGTTARPLRGSQVGA
jgi:TatA/E family protein of Tat protein translocase